MSIEQQGAEREYGELMFPPEFVEELVDEAYLALRKYLQRQDIDETVRALMDDVVYGMALQRYFPAERRWKQGMERYNDEVVELLSNLAWEVKRLQE